MLLQLSPAVRRLPEADVVKQSVLRREEMSDEEKVAECKFF